MRLLHGLRLLPQRLEILSLFLTSTAGSCVDPGSPCEWLAADGSVISSLPAPGWHEGIDLLTQHSNAWLRNGNFSGVSAVSRSTEFGFFPGRGALHLVDVSNVTIVASQFVRNTKHGYGHTRNDMCSIIQSADQWCHDHGAAAFVHQSTVSFQACRFEENSAAMGAAVYLGSDVAQYVYGLPNPHVACNSVVPTVGKFDFCAFVGNLAGSGDDLRTPGQAPQGAGAVTVGAGAHVCFKMTTFSSNRALGFSKGGAVYMRPMPFAPGDFAPILSPCGNVVHAQVEFLSCAFTSNLADLEDGDSIYADSPGRFYVYNTTFDPFESGPRRTVNLNMLAGCENYPCPQGQGCTYTNYSLLCVPCSGATVSVDGLVCNPCPVGQGPNANSSACQDCAQSEYGLGICQPCLLP
eukprot:SAG31_NODE_6444_length_2015_cov_5.114301_1_plen_406_part_01